MKRQAGFTLIELLISMTLLGLLFVLLFGGMRFGMRAWEHGSRTADSVDTVRIAQVLLRGEIERTCPRRLPPATVQDVPRVDFAGDPSAMQLLAPAPGAAGGRRCVSITLSIQPDGQHERLVLGVNRAGSDLLRHVQSVQFAYLAPDGGWRNSWHGQTDLPALVRVRVTFPDGDTRIWPELFLTPRISAEADCTYDPATKSCRGS
jgi:general secretion pathway protein J